MSACKSYHLLLGPLRVALMWPGPPFALTRPGRCWPISVEEGTAHRREELAGLLWPGYPERNARQSLSQALSSLRAALGPAAAAEPPLLSATRQDVQLNPSPHVQVDISLFAALLEASARHAHPDLSLCAACGWRLQQAVALYEGEFLAGFTLDDCAEFEEWLVLQRERYRRQAVEALHALVAGHEQRGALDLALPRARRWAELEPLDEEAHRAIMRLLALTGQRAAALAQYEHCCQLLQQDLELLPEPATQRLWARIRAGELSGPADDVERRAASRA